MSGEFQSADNGKMLYWTVSSRAAPIVPFTNSLCQAYGYTAAMTKSFPVQVDPEPFCGVVEAVFENPDILTFPWAWYAATMYDNLKGKTHSWEWPVAEIPNELDYWVANEYIQLMPVADWKPQGQPNSASGITRSSRLVHKATAGGQHNVVFKVTDSDETYGHVSAATARIFFELTTGLAAYLEEDPACVRLTNDFFIIDRSKFSKLVIKLPSWELDLYFQWFRLAIALYNQIDYPVPKWQWRVMSELPLMSYAVYDNVIVVEPRWIEGQQQVGPPSSFVLPPDLG